MDAQLPAPDEAERLPDLPPDPRQRLPDVPMPPTGVQLQEPQDPQYADTGVATRYNITDLLDQRIRAASAGAASSPANEARKNLQVARDLGAHPDILAGANEAVDQYEKQSKQDALSWKLAQLPRIAAWMAQGTQYAAAVQGEVDQWGVLDWLFGKYTPDPNALARSQAIMRGEPYTADKGVTQPPGWLLAYGKAAYSTATSVQTFAQVAWGDGKPAEQIAAERDVATQPVPGESDSTPWLRHANSIVGMAPLIGAGMVHPAAAFGLMYTESVGRNYEDLTLQGYEPREARDVANLIGFTTAAIGSALGPWSRNKVLPQATAGSLANLSNALVSSVARKPALWRGLFDLGRNFTAAMGMNIAMATSEAAIKEAFDSAKGGRPYDHSRAASAAASAADSWAEMAALSVVPAYEAHRARMARYEAQPQAIPPTPEEIRNQTIFDNYEQRGQALRSLHAASELSAAVTAIKDSEFMKTNPEDARDLIRKLVEPRASQNVFIHPDAFKGMSDDAYAKMGAPDLSQGRAGNVPVNIVDFLSHPDAESLLPRTAGGPDLLTQQEARRVDLTQPIKLQAAFREKATRRIVGTGPLHDTEAIPGYDHKAWDDGFVDQNGKFYSRSEARAALTAQQIPTNPRRAWMRPEDALYGEEIAPPGVLTLTQAGEAGLRRTTEFPGGREPAPVVPPDERPVPVKQAREWADDAMSKVPSGELQGRADAHDARAADATRDALSAPADATGPSPEGHAARVRADANTVLRDAARRAIKEATALGKGIAEQATDKARVAAYRAAQDLGQAHDAIMEMLGAAPKRGYAAPDLSDVRDRLIREDQLSQDFDVATVNRLLSQANPVENLSVSELREVSKALEQITAAAHAENTVLDRGVRVSKAIVIHDVGEHLGKLPNVPPGQDSTATSKAALTLKQKVGAKFAGVRAIFNAPHTLFFKMGPIGDGLWFNGLVSGVAKEERMWGNAEKQLKTVSDALPEALRGQGDDLVPALGPNAEQWGMRTRSDVWRMALHLGTQGSDVKISQGMGISPAQLHDWVQKYMGRTPEDAKALMKGLVEPHWKIFGDVWDEYQKHFKDRGLAPPQKLKVQSLMIHGQEFSGGYGGRLQWMNLSTGEAPPHSASLEALLDRSPSSAPEPDAGHLEERVPGTQGVPVLDLGGVGQSMRKEIHDIALRPFVEDAYKVFSDGGVRQLLADKIGKQALNEIYDPAGKTSFLHTVARGSVADVHTAQAFTRVVMNLQGRAAYSAFAGNLRVLGAQASHLAAAMPALGILPDHATMGVQAAMNPDRRAWALETFEVLRLRDSDYQRRAEDLNRQMTGVEPGDGIVRRNVDKLNWAAWHEMDGFLSHAIAEMKYAQMTAQWRMGKGVSHEEAVRAANKAVVMMMPAQDIYDQSSFVRDRSVAGFSFLTRNFQGTLANLAAMNWWEARVSGKTLAKPLAAAKFVGMVMAAEVLGKGALMQGGPKDGQDPVDWSKERALSALFYPYMLADPALAAYHAASGNRAAASKDMAHMMPPSMQVVASGIDDIGRVVQHGDEEAGLRAGSHLMGLILRSPLPGKAYDLYNAKTNSSSPADAAKKALGYR